MRLAIHGSVSKELCQNNCKREESLYDSTKEVDRHLSLSFDFGALCESQTSEHRVGEIEGFSSPLWDIVVFTAWNFRLSPLEHRKQSIMLFVGPDSESEGTPGISGCITRTDSAACNGTHLAVLDSSIGCAFWKLGYNAISEKPCGHVRFPPGIEAKSLHATEVDFLVLTSDHKMGLVHQFGTDFVYQPMNGIINVKLVACGIEHVLFLSTLGVVHSAGSGSRGQLGHGDIEAVNLDSPKTVQALESVFIVRLAAGGWHSVAISDTGDVYVWGWNESGQLGLPCKSLLSTNRTEKATCQTDIPDLDNSKEIGHKMSNYLFCKRVPVNINTTESYILPEATLSRKPIADQETLSRRGQTSCSCLENHIWHTSQLEEDRGSNKPADDYGGFVNFQFIPYPLNVPDDVSVMSAACGTRHTVFLTSCGHVYTCGWNSHGQLCHTDTRSRDQPELAVMATVSTKQTNMTSYLGAGDNSTESPCGHQILPEVVDIAASGWNTVLQFSDNLAAEPTHEIPSQVNICGP